MGGDTISDEQAALSVHAGLPAAAGEPPAAAADESPPAARELLGVQFTPRRVLAALLFVVLAIGVLYVVLPKLVGLRDTWSRIRRGDVWWFGLAAGMEL